MNSKLLKKKYGPLPAWAWIVIVGGTIGAYLLYRKKAASSSAASVPDPNTVDPSSPVGATYAEEAQDQAQGIDPITGETYAQEQAANAAGDAGGTGSGGGDSGSGGTDATESNPDSAAISDIDNQLGQLNTNLSSLSSGGLTDQQSPSGSFVGEVGDVASGIQGLQELFPGLFATAPNAGSNATKKPALTEKGAKRAPSGGTKPKAPKGFKAVGLGSGNWEFVPTAKKKSNGSGNAASAGAKTPVRRTVTPSGSVRRGSVGHPAPKRHVVSGKKKK